ncbi:glycoside hydrolase superfamily [Coniella lustricola]|uniref:glucan endo-1,3-beta-D-glucosidase n=1 Tax=Coniella lustricola TaxID=2025994 RepID=A0A2T2ZXI4_9PEZI|nr:glycoside hydrolase superfamily [Coniella lustricola]
MPRYSYEHDSAPDSEAFPDDPAALVPPSYQQAQQRYGAHPGPSSYPPLSNVTPGADNFGRAASGGVAGIAYNVAERSVRDSTSLDNAQPHTPAPSSPNYPQNAHMSPTSPYALEPTLRPAPPVRPAGPEDLPDRGSHSSMQMLNAAAVPMGQASPGYGPYTDDPYQGYSGHSNSALGYVNPDDIFDDGDDGLEYNYQNGQNRRSMLSLGGTSNRSGGQAGTAVAAAGGAAAGTAGVMGAFGGLIGARNSVRDGGGQYDAVRNAQTSYQGGGGSSGSYDLANARTEKSPWLAQQGSSAKKWRWLIGGGIALLVAVGIALGVYFGLKNRSSSSSSGSAADDTAANGDLNINSSEIKALLNNNKLHKVFPGIDYTPINTQYPDCLSNPPSQNNVTRDLAVLSQLTNTIRLYGTDCNQTEMLITAIDRLEMNDTVKIWMGVWQDNNATTGTRQLAQMWDILDKYGADPFKGVIVANEIIFRQQMTVTTLGNLLNEVRTNITAKGMSLPVATSDLGTDWTTELADASDYIMANIHPFFGGVPAKEAAAWTYNFWEQFDGEFFKSDTSKNIIAETGWPSQGGTDCGTGDPSNDCADGSVAGIDEMNTFMDDWVCQALANGTQYFWFESFDEPWKIMYDNGTENWEDHWGLMDVNRNLKSGVTIPDCDGKTVD